MVSFVKWLVIVIPLLTMVVASEEKPIEKDQAWICVRWQWAKQDCSNKLHKDICKHGGL